MNSLLDHGLVAVLIMDRRDWMLIVCYHQGPSTHYKNEGQRDCDIAQNLVAFS